MTLSRVSTSRGCLAVALFLLATPVLGDQTRGGDAATKARHVVAAAVDRHRVPGIAVVVTRDGEEVFAHLSGFADLENNVRVSRQTYFRFASVSKPITAVIAMKLVEIGIIQLDAKLETYWEDVPESMRQMTLRQLLAHQSGLRHYQPTAWTAPLQHYSSLQSRIDQSRDDSVLFTPGQRFSYSIFGYVVAGRALEVASRKRYLQLAREHVLGPAAMGTARADDLYEVIPGRARGYFIGIDNRLRNAVPVDVTGKLPGGGLGGTIVDLSAFAAAIATNQLLQPASRAAMWAPQSLNSGEPTDYGLGWHVQDKSIGKVIYHTGSQPGVSSLILLCPAAQWSVVILCNREQVDLTALGFSLSDIWLESQIR